MVIFRYGNYKFNTQGNINIKSLIKLNITIKMLTQLQNSAKKI